MTSSGMSDKFGVAPFLYGDDFGVKNEDIGSESAYFWNVNLE